MDPSTTSRSLAGFASTAVTLPCPTPSASTTSAPINSWTKSAAGSSSGSAASRAPRRRSAASRSVTPSKQTRWHVRCGRTETTVSCAGDAPAPCGDDRHPRAWLQALGPVRHEHHDDLTCEPVGLDDSADLEERHVPPAQSTMSTVASDPSRAAAARTSTRRACATRPRLPMIRPMSPGATWRSKRVPLRPASDPTTTASGSSTIERRDVLEHRARDATRDAVAGSSSDPVHGAFAPSTSSSSRRRRARRRRSSASSSSSAWSASLAGRRLRRRRRRRYEPKSGPSNTGVSEAIGFLSHSLSTAAACSRGFDGLRHPPRLGHRRSLGGGRSTVTSALRGLLRRLLFRLFAAFLAGFLGRGPFLGRLALFPRRFRRLGRPRRRRTHPTRRRSRESCARSRSPRALHQPGDGLGVVHLEERRSARGTYVPMASMNRPSRGERLSATTIRYVGCFFFPSASSGASRPRLSRFLWCRSKSGAGLPRLAAGGRHPATLAFLRLRRGGPAPSSPTNASASASP